jgi:hypothetical protein
VGEHNGLRSVLFFGTNISPHWQVINEPFIPIFLKNGRLELCNDVFGKFQRAELGVDDGVVYSTTALENPTTLG